MAPAIVGSWLYVGNWPLHHLEGWADIYLSSANSLQSSLPFTRPTHPIWCHFCVGRALDGPLKMAIVTFDWTLRDGLGH